MSRTYKVVMGACAFIAGAVMLAYLAVASISLGDGPGVGIEIPREVNIISAVLIILSGSIAGEAWLTHHAIRDNLGPVFRKEIHQAFAEFMPKLAAEVASEVSCRTGAVIREVVTGEINDIVIAGMRKAYRAGEIAGLQANGSAAVAKVVKMRIADDDNRN